MAYMGVLWEPGADNAGIVGFPRDLLKGVYMKATEYPVQWVGIVRHLEAPTYVVLYPVKFKTIRIVYDVPYDQARDWGNEGNIGLE
jgi:hypothetical protein